MSLVLLIAILSLATLVRSNCICQYPACSCCATDESLDLCAAIPFDGSRISVMVGNTFHYVNSVGCASVKNTNDTCLTITPHGTIYCVTATALGTTPQELGCFSLKGRALVAAKPVAAPPPPPLNITCSVCMDRMKVALQETIVAQGCSLGSATFPVHCDQLFNYSGSVASCKKALVALQNFCFQFGEKWIKLHLAQTSQALCINMNLC